MSFESRIQIRRASPYSVTYGNNRGALINAAILQASLLYNVSGTKQEVTLEPYKLYKIEVPIVGRSGVMLVGYETRIQPTYGDAADADNPANCVIGVTGAVNTTLLDTTLTARIPYNNETLPVASAGNIQAGRYVLVEGHNEPFIDDPVGGDALGESDGDDVVRSEVLKVASVASLNLNLAWSTRHHWGHNGVTVRGVIPIVGFEVHGLTLLGSVDGVTTAVGIRAIYSLDLTIRNVKFSGMSRFGVDVRGVTGATIQGLKSLGTNNGWWQFYSVSDWEISEFSGTRGAPSSHSLGYTRYPALFRGRCTSGSCRNGVVEGTTFGMYVAGGKHLRFHDIIIRDVEVTDDAYDRHVASGDLQSLGQAMLGFGMGFGPLNIAEFSHDVQVSNLQTENLRTPGTGAWTTGTPYRAVALLFHDCLALSLTNVSAINAGETATTYCVAGVGLVDVDVMFKNLRVRGHQYGVFTENSSNLIRGDGLIVEGGSGESPNANIPLYLDHVAGQHNIYIRNVVFSNTFSAIRYGTEFAYDANIVIENLRTDAGMWGRCVMVDSGVISCSTGDVMQIDRSVETKRAVKVPVITDPNFEAQLCVIATGTGTGQDVGTGFHFAAMLPDSLAVVNVSTPTEHGEVLVYDRNDTRKLRRNDRVGVPLATTRDRSTVAGNTFVSGAPAHQDADRSLFLPALSEWPAVTSRVVAGGFNPTWLTRGDEMSGSVLDRVGTNHLAATGTITYDAIKAGRRGVRVTANASGFNGGDVLDFANTNTVFGVQFALENAVAQQRTVLGRSAQNGPSERFAIISVHSSAGGGLANKIIVQLYDGTISRSVTLEKTHVDNVPRLVLAHIDRTMGKLRALVVTQGEAIVSGEANLDTLATLSGGTVRTFAYGYAPGLQHGDTCWLGGAFAKIDASMTGASLLTDLAKALVPGAS
jgi:hypothetical protein